MFYMKTFFKSVLMAVGFFCMIQPVVAVAQELDRQKNNMFSYNDNDLWIGLSAGWTAKDWVTSYKGRNYHEDLWGNPDKMLHGLQVGVRLQQGLYYGLGYRTGLYYEWYISTDKSIKERGFSRFNEHNLYLPLHIMFRLDPFEDVSITPYGGIGFNWAIYGNFKKGPISNASGYYDYYGSSIGGSIVYSIADALINPYGRRYYPIEYFDYNNHSPHHWNVQAEAGVALRYKHFELSFTYSWGLNRHWLYDDMPSHQNKMAANLSYIIFDD